MIAATTIAEAVLIVTPHPLAQPHPVARIEGCLGAGRRLFLDANHKSGVWLQAIDILERLKD
jgi:hypothetical protein